MVRQPPPGVEYKGNEKYEGYCADLAHAVAKIANFDYIIQPVKDGAYGTRGDDGSWNGMIGELIREVSSTSLFSCSDRMRGLV